MRQFAVYAHVASDGLRSSRRSVKHDQLGKLRGSQEEGTSPTAVCRSFVSLYACINGFFAGLILGRTARRQCSFAGLHQEWRQNTDQRKVVTGITSPLGISVEPHRLSPTVHGKA